MGRLFASEMGGQISWLLPAALIALARAWLAGISPCGGRGPTSPGRVRAAVGRLAAGNRAVFSFMAGIIHPYYTIALAPAIGALVGIGAVRLWRARRSMAAGRALAGTAWPRASP